MEKSQSVSSQNELSKLYVKGFYQDCDGIPKESSHTSKLVTD